MNKKTTHKIIRSNNKETKERQRPRMIKNKCRMAKVTQKQMKKEGKRLQRHAKCPQKQLKREVTVRKNNHVKKLNDHGDTKKSQTMPNHCRAVTQQTCVQKYHKLMEKILKKTPSNNNKTQNKSLRDTTQRPEGKMSNTKNSQKNECKKMPKRQK